MPVLWTVPSVFFVIVKSELMPAVQKENSIVCTEYWKNFRYSTNDKYWASEPGDSNDTLLQWVWITQHSHQVQTKSMIVKNYRYKSQKEDSN